MKKLKIAGIAVFALLLTTVLWQVSSLRSGSRKMLALLNGDASVDIVRLTTRHQQRRLECSDPDVLQYLKRVMMGHPPQYMRIGDFTYEGNFSLAVAGGSSAPCSSARMASISLRFPTWMTSQRTRFPSWLRLRRRSGWFSTSSASPGKRLLGPSSSLRQASLLGPSMTPHLLPGNPSNYRAALDAGCAF